MEPLDVYDPAFLADPYPAYARLRDEDPVHQVQPGAWLVSRYDDVTRILRDHDRFSSSPMNMGAPGFKFLIGSDPPDHTRLRRLVNKPFHPAAIAHLEPRIRSICADMVDGLIAANERGEADLIEHVGYPLPVIVIAELLGIPSERRADFKRWSDAMLGGMSEDFDRGSGGLAAMEMFAYFNEVIEERRSHPGDDLVSLLVGGSEPLNNQELLMFCMLLLVAGNETTTNLISNGALALFDRPEAVAALRADPSRIPAAIEEALRFDAPVQGLMRATTEDATLSDGTTVPRGNLVTILYGSANRDERKYGPTADDFIVDRYAGLKGVADHAGFGAGIHYCLGAPLARLEAKVVAEALLERTRGMRRTGEGVRTSNLIVRGMKSLPVAFEPVG
ncbi:MAG TPA: cytochrome P450 [Acidimicrobiales bacterium]|nr:cytochrome P450 [Acidimicrobiales bacterium]